MLLCLLGRHEVRIRSIDSTPSRRVFYLECKRCGKARRVIKSIYDRPLAMTRWEWP